MIDWVLNRLIEKQCFHNIVLREQLAGDSRSPIIADLLDEMKTNNLEAMKKIIEEGQQTGEFKSDVDVLMLSTTLFGTTIRLLARSDFTGKSTAFRILRSRNSKIILGKNLSIHLKKFFHFTLIQELNHIIDG